jgi:hypothetical protein
MKKTTYIFSLVFFAITALAEINVQEIQEGDLIFQKTTTPQGLAVKEITGSPWSHVGVIVKESERLMVAEALTEGIKITSLEKFINRNEDKNVEIKRLSPEVRRLSRSDITQLKKALYNYLDVPYDFLFRWDEGTQYCSEYVWKVFHDALGVTLGPVKKFKDYNLSGPMAQWLINKRYTEAGIPFNYNEPVVAPSDLYESDVLVDI